jgi:dUTP pyrophosphatase
MSLKVMKTLPDAVIPSRAYPTDTGLDLTAVKLHKVLPCGVYMYDTGISIELPDGYYAEIVPRSSMSKSGWMLANSVGVIDNSYRGNLLIALYHANTSMPELELPFKQCQLVIKKLELFDVVEVNSGLSNTERGNGGFGSTDI